MKNSIRTISRIQLPAFSVRRIYLVMISLTFPFIIHGQYLTRDLNVDILINQSGYVPSAKKSCLTKGETVRQFKIINLETRKIAFQGSFQPQTGDFGRYLKADFSELDTPGFYYILSDTLRSYPFEISSSVYGQPINLIVNYFSKQRCGSSTTGYLAPCHVDDGIRMDNGKRQDVSGGWHDASDLRKWVGATIYGMIGLLKAYELVDNPELKNRIIEELKWGNQYFLKMQEPQGYIMSYVGGDVKKHSDSNRWTDNEPGDEGGELHFTKPTAGKSTADMLIYGTNDDRVIRTDPLDIMGQYNFITAEAMMARITREIDENYSAKCLQAAIKGYQWCEDQDSRENPGFLGAAIHASLELFKTTGERKYKDSAVSLASILKTLQAVSEEGISGFFFVSSSEKIPYKNISRGCLELISVCDLINAFPEHADVDSWKNMIAGFSDNYLLTMAGKNSFGIVPFGLYTTEPGGNRKIGNYWYRYFMQPELDWWVGINANIASAGIGLLKAADILNNRELAATAQSQLDWIIGKNPFNSSTLIGVGYNHPKHFPGSTFLPNTPVIPGAVLNGLGGNHDDMPVIGTGNWQISEYWTPMVAYTLWLMSEISASR
jgi:hypothetical protein